MSTLCPRCGGMNLPTISPLRMRGLERWFVLCHRLAPLRRARDAHREINRVKDGRQSEVLERVETDRDHIDCHPNKPILQVLSREHVLRDKAHRGDERIE